MVEKYRCESYIHFGINLLPGSSMIEKNSLVWKHCVQIETLTSLCKNSTSYLHAIFLSSLFQVMYNLKAVHFSQVVLFSLTITHVMFCSLFSICPRYYDKNGKIKRRLSSKLNGRLKKLKILYCGDRHFGPIMLYIKSVRKQRATK